VTRSGLRVNRDLDCDSIGESASGLLVASDVQIMRKKARRWSGLYAC
jgi:hypothetical protein